ncbi:MAG: WbuC family cupin fold metalloprotein [Betaproteobacteria bacterium]
MKQISSSQLVELAQNAQNSPRRRANLNLHDTLPDPVQRLAIAMEPDTLVRPHRHPHTWELLYPLRGRFIVLYFDATGRVTDHTVLGEESAVVETPAGQWHAVLSLDIGGVIFEVKKGPYQPIAEEDFSPWFCSQEPAEIARLLDWYSSAKTGDRFNYAKHSD